VRGSRKRPRNQNRLTFTSPKGHTALLDGVYGDEHDEKGAKPAQGALIISDGRQLSRYTGEQRLKRRARADVQIYAIGIFQSVRQGRTRR
jgi:hypothetical protein